MPDLIKSVSEFGSSAYQPNKNIDRLSIQLRLNGFVFCISKPSESKIIYINEYKFINSNGKKNSWKNIIVLFEDWLIQNKMNSEQFKETKIIIDTSNYTIIPSSFLSNNDDDINLDFNQKINYQYTVFRNRILNTEQELLFSVQLGLNSIIKDYFPDSIVNHATSEIHESTFHNFKNRNTGNKIFAYVSDRDLHLMAYKNEKFVFQNCFRFTSKEDFIYFVLLIFNSQNINPDSDVLLLLGDISPSSALYNICYQYIRNVELLNNVNNLELNNEFDSLPIHQYYIQLNSAI